MQVKNLFIGNLTSSLRDKLGRIGNLDINILLDKKNMLYVLEFNARFGGYALSHLAGVDFPKLLVEMAKGSEVDKSLLDYKVGIKGMKFIEPRSV